MAPPTPDIILPKLHPIDSKRQRLVRHTLPSHSRHPGDINPRQLARECQCISLVAALRQVDGEDLLEAEGAVEDGRVLFGWSDCGEEFGLLLVN